MALAVRATFTHSSHNYSLSISYVLGTVLVIGYNCKQEMCGFHCHEADIGEQRTQTVRYIFINCNKKNGNLEGTEIENNEEKGAILDMVDPDKRY